VPSDRHYWLLKLISCRPADKAISNSFSQKEASMPVKRFIKTRPRVSFSILATVCMGASLAVTQVQANIHSQTEITQINPHQIPADLNPKSSFMESILDPIRLEAKDLLEEAKEETLIKEGETIHEVAFKDNLAHSKPIYDYTTGTSN